MAKTKVTITINGQEKMLNTVKDAYTHGGVFHADEVCTTALLIILGYDGKVYRVFNNELTDLPEDTFIFDIGGGEFDHHVKDKMKFHDDGCPKAAFSLVSEAIRIDGMTLEEYYPGFVDTIAKPIDARDNGFISDNIKASYFAEIVNPFNPLWDCEYETSTRQFWATVSVVIVILKRMLENLVSKKMAAEKVHTAEVCDGVMVLNEFVPWQTHINDDVIACAFPSLRGGWNIQLAPVKPGSFETKAEFCFNEFQKSIVTFVHPNGFLCACNTKEDVYKLISAVKKKETVSD